MTVEPALHRFAFDAMATTFEVVIPCGPIPPDYARQAADAVHREIERLEDELSRFRPTSDIYRLSLMKAGQTLRIGMAAFDCLNLSKAVHDETGGAFDITLGPLMRLWRNQDGSGRQPHPAEIEAVRPHTGCHLFKLDADELAVTVLADPLVFDLGAVGKGYALDQAVDILHQWDIHHALLSAGGSTLLGIGHPPDEDGWTLTLEGSIDGCVTLKDRAVSGSGFGVQGAHIIDPRTLEPVPPRSQRTYVSAPTAALSDALSTAFAVMTAAEQAALIERYPEVTFHPRSAESQ